MCQLEGERACFVCGRPYEVSEERRLIADENLGCGMFVDVACYEQIRAIRRSVGGSMFESMLALSERISAAVFGTRKVV